MADIYRYGGVKLAQVPAMPEGCSYGMIFYDEEDACYYWFCSSEMFFLDGDKYMIPASASYGGNAAKEGASAWNAATFTPEESEEVPDYYIVANTGNIIWSSADICQKDSDTVVFPTTKPLQYPTITFRGSSKLYCIGAAADSLVCNATVNDGGTLSWAWYEGETVVGTGNTFTPPTDTLGERSYCCVVTNTTEGELLTTTSGTVTIRVRELFDIRECIEWLLAGLCSRPLPMSQKQDVLDNKWPIEWNTLATANNISGDYKGFKMIKISNLLANYGTETLSVIATVDGVSNELPCVKIDSINDPEVGFSVFHVNNNDKLATVYLFYCAFSINEDEFMFPESGTYCFVIDVSTGLEISFDSIDFQMKLSLPEQEVSE